MTFQHILVILFCAAELASALPHSEIGGLANINHVIQDTYEDSYYRRDAAPTCSMLTIAQVKALPGWSQIQQYATDSFGSGGVEIVVNPSLFPDGPAIVCMQAGPIEIELQGPPSCTSSTTQIGGTIVGTTGMFSANTAIGDSNSATWTVTQESSLAVGSQLSASVTFPGIDIAASVTTTVTLANSLSKSFTSIVNNQQTETVAVNTVDGKTCIANVTSRTCNAQGTGSARYVATGWVWFNYNDARAPKNDPKGTKHWDYAVNIENVLTNIDDRSSSMTFSGAMTVTSNTDFKASCS